MNGIFSSRSLCSTVERKKKVNDRNVQQTLRRQMSISGKSIPFGATLPGDSNHGPTVVNFVSLDRLLNFSVPQIFYL